MRYTTLSETNSTYEVLANLKVHRYSVDFPALRKFCDDITALERQLRAWDIDEFWTLWLSHLKRIRFWNLASPLPSDHDSLCSEDLVQKLQSDLDSHKYVYPSFMESARAILSSLQELRTRGESPLLDFTCKIVANSANVGIVVAATQLIQPIEQALSDRELLNTHVLNPWQIRRADWFDKLLVIGSPRWFAKQQITEVPRSSDLTILHYCWVEAKYDPTPVFSGSLHRPHYVRERFIPVIDSAGPTTFKPEQVELIELDESTLSRVIMSDSISSNDEVDACAFQLDGGDVVLLQKDSKTLVIDLEYTTGIPVRRMPVDEIEPGIFVLVRTDMAEDYLVTVSNIILGPAMAQRTREAQRNWKQHLQNKIESNGVTQVVTELKAYGCRIATTANVRNWASPNSICTQDFNDFLSILTYVGLEKSAKIYWDLMRRIRRAHNKAGQLIRSELVSKVRSYSDLQSLDRYGRKDFTLHEAEGVRITAIRVEDVLENYYRVSPARIGQLIKL